MAIWMDEPRNVCETAGHRGDLIHKVLAVHYPTGIRATGALHLDFEIDTLFS